MKSMSRFSKFIMLAAVAFASAACGQKAVIEGSLESAPSSEVIVKLLDANKFTVLDTVSVNAAGKFTYKMDMQKGHPEFVYVFYKDTKIASLLLEAGDKVNVVADTLGTSAVEGSEESVKLAQVEKEYAAALGRFAVLASRLESASESAQAEISREMTNDYVKYYRERVKYVLENAKSMSVVPVLYQSFGDNLPLFAQYTDAIIFSTVADSLETVYPDSKYVKAIRTEAERRFGYLDLQNRLNQAVEIGYFDVELPDVNAKNVKLSDVESKVVVLYFWSAESAEQNHFNTSVLKPIYDDYHKKGLEIYQVSLDTDKALWATTVKAQELPWINVCDARGVASPYVSLYNLAGVPAIFVISNGELVDGKAIDEAAFRKMLDGLLK